MKRRAIYPGSFDPVTNGHLDLIDRAVKLFDEVIVAILRNPGKSALFTIEERMEMLRAAVPWPQVQIDAFDGLLVDYAKQKKATAIIRGIRAVSDYEYEMQMALMNRRLNPEVETIFMLPGEPYSYLSSKLVKEVFSLGGSITGLVPQLVEQRLFEKYTSLNQIPKAGTHDDE
jgi:pantetheine-phosphate adenylyltransferase